MTQASPARVKVPTTGSRQGRPPGVRAKDGRPASPRILASGTGRAATRGGGEVIELEHGITVYPARPGGGRWRATWHEDGERQQCEAASEEKLVAKLDRAVAGRCPEHEAARRGPDRALPGP